MGSAAAAVRERPILFSAPMVRAILDGRKTVTRRVVTRRVWEPEEKRHVIARPFMNYTVGLIEQDIPCPYGAPGDRLWVRETWAPFVRGDGGDGWVELLTYRADDAEVPIPAGKSEWWRHQTKDGDYRWRPSIHMPRWAARITLEVTEVSVERLQEITREDAIAEGCPGWGQFDHHTLEYDCEYPEEEFRSLWDSINAARGYGWDANPWVWRIAFRRLA